jgi:predicted patatin/cPLA2 family phospholipase
MHRLDGQNCTFQKTAMKDTARIPFFAHSVRDKTVLWDGGLKVNTPIEEAFRLGATDVLVLWSTGLEEEHFPELSERILKLYLSAASPMLAQLVKGRRESYNQAVKLIQQKNPFIHVVGLPHLPFRSSFAEESQLIEGLKAGYRQLEKSLGLAEAPYPDHWRMLGI